MTIAEAFEVLEQDIPCEKDSDLIEALEIVIRSLKVWNNLKDTIRNINGCECAECGNTKRCLFETDVMNAINRILWFDVEDTNRKEEDAEK